MTAAPVPSSSTEVQWGESRARWVLTATVLGAGLTFIDATVVNLALPAPRGRPGCGTEALTWVVNGYTLTLAALVLLGGALGDRYGRRRVYVIGVAGFAVASAVLRGRPGRGHPDRGARRPGRRRCAAHAGEPGAAPGDVRPADRSRAIGVWSGLTGVAGAAGPFFGGWVIEVADWRWAFLVNVPIAAVVVLVTQRHVPESRPPSTGGRLDWTGAGLLALCLAALTFALTAWSSAPFVSARVGGTLLVSLVARSRVRPLGAPRGRSAPPRDAVQVAGLRGANLYTFLVYAALGVVFFFLGILLQVGAGSSPIAAGLSLLPVTVLMLLFSGQAGVLMDRVGARIPMTVGPLVAAAGAALLTRIDEDTSYLLDVIVPTSVFGPASPSWSPR